MRLLVERGEIYKSVGVGGERFIIITSLHVDKSASYEGQVWAGCREVVADGGPAPSAFPDNSPLRGFKRGEPFTTYLTARDSAWRMNHGWELVGWGAPDSEVAVPAVANPEAPAVEPAPKKRGRPPKVHAAPANVEASPVQVNSKGTPVIMGCPDHPGYRGMRKCRSGCKACEAIYNKNHAAPDDGLAD